jgi:hypothetical protein
LYSQASTKVLSYWVVEIIEYLQSTSRSFNPGVNIPLIIDYLLFTSRTRAFHGNVTITGEGMQNLGLYSALRAIEQGGIFIVSHLLWHGTSFFPVSYEGPPHSVALYDKHWNAKDDAIPILMHQLRITTT